MGGAKIDINKLGVSCPFIWW